MNTMPSPPQKTCPADHAMHAVPPLRSLLVFPALFVLFIMHARAADYTYNGPSGAQSFELATNWSPNGAPGINDNATVNSAVNLSFSGTQNELNNLYLTSATSVVVYGRLPGAGSVTENSLYVQGSVVKSGAGGVTIRDNSGASNNRGNFSLVVGGSFCITTAGMNFGAAAASLSHLQVIGLFYISSAGAINFIVEDAHLDGGLHFEGNASVSIYNQEGIGGISAAFLSGRDTNGTLRANTSAGSHATLTIDGASGTHTFGGTLTDGTGGSTLDIIKTGGNTQIFSGVGSYTGKTDILGGTLLVNGNFSSARGAMTVGAGATLGGSGTLGGSVLVQNGATLSGSAGSTLELNAGAKLEAGAIIDAHLGAPGSAALFRSGGLLELDGVLNIHDMGTMIGGSYRLFDYTAGLVFSNLSIGYAGNAGRGLLFSIDTTTAGQVNLVYDNATLYIWNNAAAGRLWSGESSMITWDAAGAGASAWDGGYAVFQGAGETVNIAGSVNVKGVQFAANDYTITGGTISTDAAGPSGDVLFRVGDGTPASAGMGATMASVIAGGGGIDKSDYGTLVLAGNNTYAGATRVGAGTLRIDGDQSLATGAVSVAAGAALGGSGRTGGFVTLSDGAHLLGQAGSTFTMAGLALSENSLIDITLGSTANTLPLFTVNGALALNGIVNLSLADPSLFEGGAYCIFQYAGALTGSGLRIGALPDTLDDSIKLRFTTDTAGSVILDVSYAPPYWAGANGNGGDGVWSADQALKTWQTNDGMLGVWQASRAVFRGAQGGTIAVDNSAGEVGFTGMRFDTNGYLLAGGTLTISPDMASAAIQVGAETTGANITATIASVIAGDAALEKTGAGTLVLTGNNQYRGGTVLRSGVLQISSNANLGAPDGALVFEGGTLRLGDSFSSARNIVLNAADGRIDTGIHELSLSGNISGAGGLVKQGAGTLLLSGNNTFTGNTTINAGAIFLNESSLASVTIAPDAMLAGAGIIRGNVTNRGLLMPVSLVVEGNYTQPAVTPDPARLLIILGAPGAGMTVSGSVLLNGTLQVTPFPDTAFSPGDSFTIITANTAVSGTFATIESTLAPMLRLAPRYEGKTVTLDLLQRPFASLHATANQRAIGTALDAAISNGGAAELVHILNQLPDEKQVRAALNALSPQRFERWFGQALLTTNANVRSVENRMSLAREPREWQLWTEYAWRKSEFDSDPDLHKANATANDVLVGIDKGFAKDFTAGVMLAFGDEKIDLDDDGSTTDTRRAGAALYGRYNPGNIIFMEIVAGAGWSKLNNERMVNIPGYLRDASSKTSTREWHASLRVGKQVEVAPHGIVLTPYAAMQWLKWRANRSTETGANQASLDIDAMDNDSLASRAGLGATWSFKWGTTTWKPFADVAWRHEFRERRQKITASLAGNPFTVANAWKDDLWYDQSEYSDKQNGLSATVGLDVFVKPNVCVYLRFNEDCFMPAAQATGFNIGIAYRY